MSETGMIDVPGGRVWYQRLGEGSAISLFHYDGKLIARFPQNPAMIGQNAFDHAAEAFTALVTARRRIVETHESLDEARVRIGLREVATGDSVPKDGSFAPLATDDETRVARIRAVA